MGAGSWDSVADGFGVSLAGFGVSLVGFGDLGVGLAAGDAGEGDALGLGSRRLKLSKLTSENSFSDKSGPGGDVVAVGDSLGLTVGGLDA
ncbi:hypothetical protein [Acaryochloris sp. 'Moss Beach']|uniref:hypothetical protein n=1 Tax=Acaryochloris sp. 'Moss Beach' TaxID=2740837 RepID=UPI001F2E18E4|nr:hypothetical protein [Acaryochloris sp. 'Moss Beach']